MLNIKNLKTFSPNSSKITKCFPMILLVFLFCSLISGCTTIEGPDVAEPVYLPYIKNAANECYYLDEFMPVPDGLVAGKSGAMALRYYTYRSANYKDWMDKHIILAFYSKDRRCWSLFEEYYVEQ